MTWLPSVVLAALSVSARAGEPPEWLAMTWTRTGVDTEGASAYERLSARPDLTVSWTTASRGSDCSPEGGIYRGKLKAEELEALVSASERALSSQPSPRADSASPRDAYQELQSERGAPGTVRSGGITRATDATRELEGRMTSVKKTLKPQSAVTLTARRGPGGTIRARFRLEGLAPARLVLPRDAGEAFRIAGSSRITWAIRPKKLIVELTPRSPEISLTLAAKPVAAKRAVLRYANSLILHHLREPPDSLGSAAPELTLCAAIQAQN